MSNPFRILLVDDEVSIRTICKSYLSDVNDIVVVGEADSVTQAKVLVEACKPDLLLLDIHMGSETGFDLLREYPNPHFHVIFITAYEKYALQAIKAGALDYLLKPIVEADLKDAITKAKAKPTTMVQAYDIAQQNYNKKAVERITLSDSSGYHIVWVKDIMYCSASGNYTTFHLNGGKQIMVSKVIKEYELLLPESNFIRVHQSYLVNMHYVVQYNRDHSLILTNKSDIIVSFRKREEVLQWLKKMD